MHRKANRTYIFTTYIYSLYIYSANMYICMLMLYISEYYIPLYIFCICCHMSISCLSRFNKCLFIFCTILIHCCYFVCCMFAISSLLYLCWYEKCAEGTGRVPTQSQKDTVNISAKASITSHSAQLRSHAAVARLLKIVNNYHATTHMQDVASRGLQFHSHLRK